MKLEKKGFEDLITIEAARMGLSAKEFIRQAVAYFLLRFGSKEWLR